MYPLAISHNCKDFLDACLKYKPEERLKASQLLQMPFIVSKIIYIFLYYLMILIDYLV